jgi:hypothetical protein
MADVPKKIWVTPSVAIKHWMDIPSLNRAPRIEYTRTDIHKTALARIDEAENQLDSARHSVTVLEAKGAVSQARIAELEAALTRAVQIAENYATVYSEGKPDDWEDRADNMMWGMHRDIAALKAKP